jgi:hypothetical protein
VLGLAVLIGAFLVRRPLTRHLAPFPCSACGRMVCRRCVTRRRGLALCRQCQQAVGDIPAEAVVRLLIEVEQRRKLRQGQLRRVVWNLLIPGHGLVVAGQHFTAALLLALVAGAGVGFLAGGHPLAPLPAVPVGMIGFWGYRGFAIALLALLGLTAWSGITARPHLGKATSGRIVPLAAGRMQGDDDSSSETITEFRTGTDG